MRWNAHRKRLRGMLEDGRCLIPASVYDPLSARAAEDLGYEVGMFAGSTASLTVLGEPDLVLLTLTELAQQASRISRASELPLVVDADHGYGNALNARRTVEELEAAGVAAITLEDSLLPPPFGQAGIGLISIGESTGKIRAAIAARRDPDFLIFGRTTMAAAGLPEIIDRVRAYQAAGADGIFIAGGPGKEELAALSAELTVPLAISPMPAGSTLPELAGMGVRICLQGHLPIRAAMRAVHDTLKALREGIPPGSVDGIASKALFDQLTRKARHDADAATYLGRSRDDGSSKS